jgi:hypothetical protein
MIPRGCKRLAEVDFPIAVVSKHAAREKSIRHGHPSTLHLWWARRPLAACRAMRSDVRRHHETEDRRDRYWLYVVTHCGTQPTLQEPIKDPARFPWHEVTRVQHYWLEVNAMVKPMEVRVDPLAIGEREHQT